jgi:hypothetical protein
VTKAQALYAVAHLASVEADEVYYRYPPPELEELQEAHRIAQLGDDAFAQAGVLGATQEDWLQVMSWFGNGV